MTSAAIAGGEAEVGQAGGLGLGLVWLVRFNQPLFFGFVFEMDAIARRDRDGWFAELPLGPGPRGAPGFLLFLHHAVALAAVRSGSSV